MSAQAEPVYNEGPMQETQGLATSEDFLDLFSGEAFCKQVLNHTHSEVSVLAFQFKVKKAAHQPATVNEIKALIGVLIFLVQDNIIMSLQEKCETSILVPPCTKLLRVKNVSAL